MRPLEALAQRLSLFAQQGQAMTEMVVAFAFVAVPLFLLVPIVGKYIDMQQASTQMARYSAWERTVNYYEKDDWSSGVGLNNLPIKSNVQINQEAQLRFLSEASDDFTSGTGEGRKLWQYHNDDKMLKTLPAYQVQSNKFESSVAGNEFIAKATAKGMQAIGDIASLVTSIPGIKGKFDAIDMRGASTAQSQLGVEMPLSWSGLNNASSPLIDLPSDLRFGAQAYVLALPWGAAGPEQLQYQAGSLAPMHSFKFPSFSIPGFGRVQSQNILAKALISPELGTKSLNFQVMERDLDSSETYRASADNALLPQGLDILPRDKYLSVDGDELYPDNAQTVGSCDTGYCRE